MEELSNSNNIIREENIKIDMYSDWNTDDNTKESERFESSDGVLFMTRRNVILSQCQDETDDSKKIKQEAGNVKNVR